MSDKKDKKITISKGFAKTFQIKDFEPAKFTSFRSIDIPADTTMKEQQDIAEELFALCMSDILKDKNDYLNLAKTFSKGVDAKKLRELEDQYATGAIIQMEDFEACTMEQQMHLNHFKKYYKRSPAYKATLKERE